MADIMEEFNRLSKAVIELDEVVLKKLDDVALKNEASMRTRQLTEKVDFQLTEIKSSLAYIKSLVSEDVYKEVFSYFDVFLPWMERHLRFKDWIGVKSNVVSIKTGLLPKIKTKLLAQKKLEGKKLLASNNVFVVHGRDHKPMKELKEMLQEFGLNPIILHEQPSGSRTIVEKLEKHSDVGYAFVILTPDDVGALYSKFAKIRPELLIKRSLKSILNLKPRARQNVVLEFGYFIGLLSRDRVCCLYKGDVELPSDMHGIVYVPFKESVNEVRDKIVKELKEAGYKIKFGG